MDMNNMEKKIMNYLWTDDSMELRRLRGELKSMVFSQDIRPNEIDRLFTLIYNSIKDIKVGKLLTLYYDIGIYDTLFPNAVTSTEQNKTYRDLRGGYIESTIHTISTLNKEGNVDAPFIYSILYRYQIQLNTEDVGEYNEEQYLLNKQEATEKTILGANIGIFTAQQKEDFEHYLKLASVSLPTLYLEESVHNYYQIGVDITKNTQNYLKKIEKILDFNTLLYTRKHTNRNRTLEEQEYYAKSLLNKLRNKAGVRKGFSVPDSVKKYIKNKVRPTDFELVIRQVEEMAILDKHKIDAMVSAVNQ